MYATQNKYIRDLTSTWSRKEIRFERKHKRVLGKRNSNKSLVMECKNILLIEKIFTKEKFLYWKYKEEVRNVLEYFIYIDSYISAVSGYISIHMYVGMHISQGYEEYWEKHILIFFLWKMYLSKDPMTMNLVISSYITSVLHCVKAVSLYLHTCAIHQYTRLFSKFRRSKRKKKILCFEMLFISQYIPSKVQYILFSILLIYRFRIHEFLGCCYVYCLTGLDIIREQNSV